mgnify:FL=1
MKKLSSPSEHSGASSGLSVAAGSARRRRGCRYGKNGYFGICSCDACRQIVIITDDMRMDWLVKMAVEVRTPALYGSHALFHAQSLADEGEEHRTDLRAQIDQHLRREILASRNGRGQMREEAPAGLQPNLPK